MARYEEQEPDTRASRSPALMSEFWSSPGAEHTEEGADFMVHGGFSCAETLESLFDTADARPAGEPGGRATSCEPHRRTWQSGPVATRASSHGRQARGQGAVNFRIFAFYKLSYLSPSLIVGPGGSSRPVIMPSIIRRIAEAGGRQADSPRSSGGQRFLLRSASPWTTRRSVYEAGPRPTPGQMLSPAAGVPIHWNCYQRPPRQTWSLAEEW
jgi:hypothetical protein